jgi:hypothetical protein
MDQVIAPGRAPRHRRRRAAHQSIDTRTTAETFKHVLLPIWMAAYRYRDKSYRFIVNAQTGKVQGERPWSVWKIAAAVVAAAIVLGLVAYFAELN